MKRLEFLKQGIAGGLSLAFLPKSGSLPACSPTPEETKGPFPTHDPSNYLRKDITAGKPGTPLKIHLSVYNITQNCLPFPGAIVDVWHCDHQGEYSEYGGGRTGAMPASPPADGSGPPTGPPPREPGQNLPPPPPGAMIQGHDHSGEHYLRGRQVTSQAGEVIFQSIFPGWYFSRAPHVHVEIRDSLGKSILVTQIAFPEEVCQVVYSQGIYAPRGMPETSNADDMVFSDSLAREMPTLTGGLSGGFELRHSIYVKA